MAMAMSTTRLIIPYSLTSSDLHIKPRCELQQNLIFNPIFQNPAISKHKHGSCFLVNRQGLRYFSNGLRAQADSNSKTDVNSSIQPGGPLPSVPPPDSWRSWILGALVSIILPFFRHKWGPLFKLTKDVEAAVEIMDHGAEIIEKAATEVDKIAEDIADDLPESGKLRRAVELLEDAAEKTAKKAHLAGELIDKVEAAVKEGEEFMEPVNDKPKE